MKINIEALKTAMVILPKDCFRVWIYFASQKNNYTFALYKENVMNFCDIKESSYHKYINILIEKGYLIKIKEITNHYYFFDFPREDMIVTKKSEKDFIF